MKNDNLKRGKCEHDNNDGKKNYYIKKELAYNPINKNQ